MPNPSVSFNETLKFLEDVDRAERPFRTKNRMEIFGKTIYIPLIYHDQAGVLRTIEEEIKRCWLEANWCYTYGFFQASIILDAITVELLIERYIRAKDLWDEYESVTPSNHRTFGSLIQFCKDRAYLPSSVIRPCSSLRDLRNEAAHGGRRRKILADNPTEFDFVDALDEIEDVSTLRKDDLGHLRLVANTTIDEMDLLYDENTGRFQKIRYLKKYARDALRLTLIIASTIERVY